MSHLRGKASEWAYSALLADAKAFPSWAILMAKIRAMYQPPNNKVLFQARFFGARQAKRSLQECAQEMRSLSASITVGPIPEHLKVPTFMNGLRHGASRQALFRKGAVDAVDNKRGNTDCLSCGPILQQCLGDCLV